MKKILIIDNDTGAIEDLKDSLKNVKYGIINFKEFRVEQARGYTHIILTGGDYWANLRKFSEEVKLIRDCPSKILGICFGMQLIAKTFGSKLKYLDKIRKGNLNVRIIKKDDLFLGIKNKINVFQYHGYAVGIVGNDLEILAESRDGIEAIKHKSLPIWGVQFHPEVIYENKGEGRKIIKRFLSL